MKKIINWIDEDLGSFFVIAVFGILLFTGFILGCGLVYNAFMK